MNNLQHYKEVFAITFGVNIDEVQDLKFKSIPAWDSVGQMNLLGAIESAFGIQLDPDDMIDLVSYETGKKILSERYNIQFD